MTVSRKLELTMRGIVKPACSNPNRFDDPYLMVGDSGEDPFHTSKHQKYTTLPVLASFLNYDEKELEQYVARTTHRKPSIWRDLLLELALAPEMIMRHHHFLAGTPDEESVVVNMAAFYGVLAKWMDYLNPGDKPFPLELATDLAKAIESRAQFSKAFLNLATVLYPKVEALQAAESPAQIWLDWEVQSCEASLLNCGLLTGNSSPFSKRQTYKSALEAIKSLESVDSIALPSKTKGSTGKAAAAVELWAHTYASQSQNFRASSAYRNYINAGRKLANAIRKNKAFTSPRLKNGHLTNQRIIVADPLQKNW